MRTLDLSYLASCIPLLIRGIPVCLQVTLFTLVAGLILGLVVALIRVYKVPVLSQIATLYISVMRGTPLMVQILVFYYGLPMLLEWMRFRFGLGITVSGIPALYYMFVCYSFCYAAYFSEVYRSAILSVDSGQMEACLSIGMTRSQGMVRAIIPQAISSAIPNFGNFVVSLVKDTSLCFSVGIAEVLGQAKIAAGRSSKFLEAFLAAALIYWVLCTILSFVLGLLEKRSRKHEKALSKAA